MTEALVRLADTLAVAPPGDSPTQLVQGTVIQAVAPIRVDVGAMQLSCLAIAHVAVGQIVYVLRAGTLNIVLGTADSLDGAWHNVGDPGEPGFVNSWANYGAVYQTLRFMRERGRVYVEGTIKGGSNTTIAFQLPVGYRPSASVQRSSRGADAGSVERISLVDIPTNGNVQIIFTGGTNPASAVTLGFDFPTD